SAASSTSPASRTRPEAEAPPGSASHGVPWKTTASVRRARSTPSIGAIAIPCAPRSTRPSAPPASPTTRRSACDACGTWVLVPVSRSPAASAHSSGCQSPPGSPSATVASASPVARRGSQPSRCPSRPAGSIARPARRGAGERARAPAVAQRLGGEREVDQAEARAAEALGEVQAAEAELDHALPQRRIVAKALEDPAQVHGPALVREEAAQRLLEQ